MAELVTIRVVEANGSSQTFTADAPANVDMLLKRLSFGHGPGDLFSGQDRLPLVDALPPGNYTYKCNPVAQAPVPPAGVPTATLTIAPGDTQVQDSFARVSPLIYKDEVIGTAVRCFDDIVVTCRHCVVEHGDCLKNLFAFNSPLKFVGAQRKLDVAIFKGAKGPAFQLAPADAQPGHAVHLLSFPLAIAKELQLQQGSCCPAVDAGIVSQMSETGRHCAATFGTAMPNSSGGAVVTDTRTLVGVHVAAIYHLDELPEGGSGIRSSSGGGSSSSSAAPFTVERAGEQLWEEEDYTDPIQEAAASDSDAAHLSRINIPQKSSATLFFPATALRSCLVDLQLVGEGPVDAAATRVVKERKKPRIQRGG